jgi:hypothetical protein
MDVHDASGTVGAGFVSLYSDEEYRDQGDQDCNDAGKLDGGEARR